MRKKGAALRAVQEERLHPSGARHAPGMAALGSPAVPAQGGEVATRPPLPEFAPVPRRYRHDGWTPERQKAFIEALADTGCVTRAAAMVNMSQANCYALRRAPGAEEFRRAWDAALDFGLKRLKDIAFERAIEGQLVPVFVAGKLMGFRRKRNDALLMFCLRHYGQDAEGKRTTINYFSTRASAGAVAAPSEGAPPPPSAVPLPQKSGGGLVGAEASTMTVRTVISGVPGGGDMAARDDATAGVLNGFAGVALDAEAEAAIAAALEACAARARAAEAAYAEGGLAAADAAADDPDESFVRSEDYRGELVPAVTLEEFVPFVEGEPHWSLAGAEKPAALVQWEGERAKGEKG
ncbi:hypothetical protein RCO27_05750 [Sphingosinicella sp. LHD-64]|uniref:hypothetical protein n=1 Tax=Sphingosinicella sp. LHD-64 TaxID=3072139 RepID=UPI00280E73CC|nr:hypothetical protein [Sphingosinicella sp. LHD-64]MDQ8755728.1 hypothetical protein [Sphingosinicella sp. LHD-64]